MSVRRAAVIALAALLSTSCGAGPGGAPAVGVPTTTTSAAVAALPQDEVGRAHRAALGLIALGELGQDQGSTQALRSLAARTAGDGRALDDQIRELAATGALVLSDDLDAPTQGVLADLRTRSGGDFDRAWLQAVAGVVGQGRQAADDIRSAPGVDREAGSVAFNVLARLAALANALGKAIARAGAPAR